MIESSYSDYLDQTYSCIRNKDEKEFTFGFKGDVTDNIYAERFMYLTIGSNLDGEDNVIPEFNINGVTEKITNENVKEIFGEPNTIENSDNSLIYCVNDGQVIFWFNDDGTVKCVQIFLQ